MTLIEAIALLNERFQSKDGRPVNQAVITLKDYKVLVETMAEADTQIDLLRYDLRDDGP